MKNDVYFSIKSSTQAECKEKGSKFISFAFPVTNEAGIKLYLTKLKEEYWDASHHCYAYMLGHRQEIYALMMQENLIILQVTQFYRKSGL